MSKVIVSGRKELNIYWKNSVFRFDIDGRCVMDSKEFDEISTKYRNLEIIGEVPERKQAPKPVVEKKPEVKVNIVMPPEPEKKVEKPKETPKPKPTKATTTNTKKKGK